MTALEERAAIVAYLRDAADLCREEGAAVRDADRERFNELLFCAHELRMRADRIERGDHVARLDGIRA